MSHADRDQRFALLARRIRPDYILNHDVIYTALSQDYRKPRILWVLSPTGRPHMGYMIPMLKFMEFLRADCEIVACLLDSYSYVDNVKFSWETVQQRAQVYRYTAEAAVAAIGIDPKRLIFVHESHHETNEKWIKDCWRMCTLAKQQDVRDSWDRAVHPDMLSPLLAPVHQSLCEEYLNIDIQFGGYDQLGLFNFGDRFLQEMGYRKRGHLMNFMLPNLMGGKMSSSHPGDTKLMLTEDSASITAKMTKSFSVADDKFKCGAMNVLEHVLIPFSQTQEERAKDADAYAARGMTDPHQSAPFWTEISPAGTAFSVEHNSQIIHFKSFDDIVNALRNGSLSFESLMAAIIDATIQLCAPVRKIWLGSPAWQMADRLSYPDEYAAREAAAATGSAVPVPVVVTKSMPATNGHTNGVSTTINGGINGVAIEGA